MQVAALWEVPETNSGLIYLVETENFGSIPTTCFNK
jgi:hypothetical protein